MAQSTALKLAGLATAAGIGAALMASWNRNRNGNGAPAEPEGTPPREVYDERKPHVLVTGGAGYIGSHTVLVLLEAGFEVTVFDNLDNSSLESLRRVGQLTGRSESMHFHHVDVADPEQLERGLSVVPPVEACMHFAALKSVGDSVKQPLAYFANNVGGTITLLQSLHRHGCRQFVFSSSATVYGTAPSPVTEASPVGVGITNPYGRSKFIVEEILRDFCASPDGQDWSVMVLRYFNPVGAHESGRIGEDPNGVPNNLMPFVTQVAVGRRKQLTVFGDDYPTVDGTGVRDYIHVMDLAEAHVSALGHMSKQGPQLHIYNLGSGTGASVLEMVEAMKQASGRPIPYTVGPKRDGDLAAVFADPSKAERDFGWKTKRGLKKMCEDMWRWQEGNPWGFNDEDEHQQAPPAACILDRRMSLFGP